jgi:predicted Zn-dependent protease
MNRFLAFVFLLVFPSLFAVQAWGQESAPRLQETTARTAEAPARAAPASRNLLFGTISVSTHSDEARQSLELALDKYENDLLDDALVHAQHATEKDPHFALGYAVLAYASRRGTPNEAASARAKSLLPFASADEQLLARWMTSVQDGDLLPAIMLMNDLINGHPKDKHILYLTSEWLYSQEDYDQARSLMEKALKADPNFAPALNKLGYIYLHTATPDPTRAAAALQRYAELQPGSPNPEVSLGEILRYIGDDQGSLRHYADALQLDPTHFPARLGLADTLTLRSEYADARREYDKAVSVAETSRDAFHAEYQKAFVYFWEGQPAQGQKALEMLLQKAQKQKDAYAQCEIASGRAILTPDETSALEQLRALEGFLQHSVAGMNEDDRNICLASVLREAARVAALHGHLDAAQEEIGKLEKLAAKTRDMMIENRYESARGYLFFAQADFASSADELTTDLNSPLVVQQLALAQEKLGNATRAQAMRARLKFMRAATAEWYLASHPSANVTR